MIRTLVLIVLLAPSQGFANIIHHPKPAPVADTTSTSTASSVILETPLSIAFVPIRHDCVEHTDVVGIRQCTRFGTWSLIAPAVAVDIGFHMRHLAVTPFGNPALLLRTVGAPAPPSTTAMLSAMRIGLGIGAHLYVALEGEMGSATPSPEIADQTPGVFLGGYGVVGARAATRHALFAVELVGGGRDVLENYEMAPANSRVLETRARVELPLGPWAAIGATLGSSVIEHDDWMAGLYVGVHSLAFSGGR
jgi:hypothetical protein